MTPEQSAKVLALQQAHLEQITPIQEKMFAKRLELRSLWTAAKPDQAKINTLQKEVLDLVDQIQKLSIKHRGEVLKVLAP